MNRQAHVGRTLALVVLALVGPSATYGDEPQTGGRGSVCMLNGVAEYDTPITIDPVPFTYVFQGVLEDCRSEVAADPATATIQSGGIYRVDGIDYRLPTPGGVGGCSTSRSSGFSVTDWADGTKTIIEFETSSVTGAGILTGRVIDTLQVHPVDPGPALTIRTTRAVDADAAGVFGFEADVSDCLTGGTRAGIRGMIMSRPASTMPHSVCTFESTATFDPGIFPNRTSSGTFESTAGTSMCLGKASGTGTLRYSGSYGPGDTCDAGMGQGIFEYTIGPEGYQGWFTFLRVGAFSTFRGVFSDGGTIFGLTQTLATQGDCLTTPITAARIFDQTEIR